MSGYCPDCGNTLCVCSDIERFKVRHKKTGVIYYIEGYAMNATNGFEDQSMVIYHHPEHNTTFVREEREFWAKFEEIKPKGENK